MSEFALSKNRTHYEKGKVRAWACNPLSGSAESNPVERTAVDWLATIATSEGLARGPHPAAHPLPHSWNQVQPGLLIQVLLGHFVYSISARCHVEHIRKLELAAATFDARDPCGPAHGGQHGGGHRHHPPRPGGRVLRGRTLQVRVPRVVVAWRGQESGGHRPHSL